MRPDVLGVIGLGAIGGSLAWQAVRAGVPSVLGYSPSPREGVAAAKAGAITEYTQTLRSLLRRAELVVFAAPPGPTLQLLRQHGPALGARGVLCTDVTSVKAPVVRLAAELGLGGVFAGSHPFAGTHEQGFAAARPELLRGAVVYLTPVGAHDGPAREVAHFWSDVIEAHPVIADAAEHDALMAWTSHLPQAVASALAATLAHAGPPGAMTGRGARDTTRLAGSSVAMWRDLLLLNRDAVLRTLDGLDDQIGILRQALASGDGDAVADWLDRARTWRRGLGP